MRIAFSRPRGRTYMYRYMASCEIRIVMSKGYSLLRVSTISRGDQHFLSPLMTSFRIWGSCASRDFPCLREEAERFDRCPAEKARYAVVPLRPISREIVLGLLPGRMAISTGLIPDARPLLVSSRSLVLSRLYCCMRIVYPLR